MENEELMLSKNKDVDQSGYSEKKLDQDTDLQAGQWLDLNKGSNKKTPTSQKNQQAPSQNITTQPDEKEEIAKQIVEQNNLIGQLITEYSQRHEFHSKEAERLLQRIFTVQASLKTLLQTLKKIS